MCTEISPPFPPCGAPGSPFQTDGCYRRPCLSDSECDDGERCLASPLVNAFHPVPFEGCFASPDGGCSCYWDAYPGWNLRCIPETEAPRANDCPVDAADCPSDAWETTLVRLLDNERDSSDPAIRADLEACLASVEEARADCDPE